MEDKDYYIRRKGRNPQKAKCNSNLIDDGFNCIDDYVCKRVKCEDGNCIDCNNNNNIVKSYEERFHCNKNEEKIDNLCYKKCNPGYVSQGIKCIKGIYNVTSEKTVPYIKNSINLNYTNKNFHKIMKKCKKYKWYLLFLLVLLVLLINYIFFNNNVKNTNIESLSKINTTTDS